MARGTTTMTTPAPRIATTTTPTTVTTITGFGCVVGLSMSLCPFSGVAQSVYMVTNAPKLRDTIGHGAVAGRKAAVRCPVPTMPGDHGFLVEVKERNSAGASGPRWFVQPGIQQKSGTPWI